MRYVFKHCSPAHPPVSALAPFGFHFFLLLWTEITRFVDQYHIMMKRRRCSFGESEYVTKTDYFISFVFEKRVITSLSFIILKLYYYVLQFVIYSFLFELREIYDFKRFES